MAKAFVIVTGEYSNYQVVSVWTNRQEAEVEVETLKVTTNAYDPRIEEYPLNSPSNSEDYPHYK